MKTIIIALALIFSVAMTAQEVQPKFEKEDNALKATYFHDNGNIAQIGFFRDGKLHGEWKMFDEKGKKIAMGEYLNGKKVGKWFFWEGEVLKEVDYTNNKIANVTTWDNGKTVAVNK